MGLFDIAGSALDALRSAGTSVSGFAPPTLRLGVTGLARAGKTVFITALVRNLVRGGRLPFFAPQAEGRILTAFLEPQPDDAVPRFDYETHVAALTSDPPYWPDSTRTISQLRVTIAWRPAGAIRRQLGDRKLHIDIVDYPGEWVLDLALLDLGYADWSRQALADARAPQRGKPAAPFLAFLATIDPAAAQDEQKVRDGARLYTAYLHAARAADPALSTIGPGRFLLPGDLAGSPLVTFFPLVAGEGRPVRSGSMAHMMERRFESYKALAIKPFFRDHFSRLDRQIVLVDALAALNAGPAAVEDLSRALEATLRAFRPGANGWLSSLLGRRIDRVLYAATKADHLPQSSHDRLEQALALITSGAARRAGVAGAEIKSLAIAALRATREVERRQGRDTLPCILGVPLPGERIANRVYDGATEAAIFPGDLPADLAGHLSGRGGGGAMASDLCLVRFRPPRLAAEGATIEPEPWPHVRLDRALDFLLGDRLV